LVAVRTSPWINPQFVFGKPLDKLAVDTPAWMPQWYTLSSFHVIRRVLIGGFRRLGLKRPKHGLNDQLPISDRGIVAAVREGRVVMRSKVVGFADGAARFDDPSHADEPVDVALFATGFARKYPLLCEQGAPVDRIADALSFLVFHRSEPGLAYVAETVGLRGGWPVFVDQARAIAAYYAAEAAGRPNVCRFNARRTLPTPNFKGALFRRANKFHLNYDIYQAALRDLSAWLAE
jgi:hypothetical protein